MSGDRVVMSLTRCENRTRNRTLQQRGHFKADSIVESSPAENLRLFNAPTASSTCATLLAPIHAEVTVLWRSIQAAAIGASDCRHAFASSLSSLTSSIFAGTGHGSPAGDRRAIWRIIMSIG